MGKANIKRQDHLAISWKVSSSKDSKFNVGASGCGAGGCGFAEKPRTPLDINLGLRKENYAPTSLPS